MDKSTDSTRRDLPPQVLRERIIPVGRALRLDVALQLADALRVGGITTLEVTMEAGGSEIVISSLVERGVTVGAGTVMTIDQAEAAVDAGAGFLVSPNLNFELIEWSRERGHTYIPGVFTPTEVSRALAAGIRTVKLFPASLGGSRLISAIRGPFPHIQIVATGGITSDNARDLVDAGALAVGVGSWLTASTNPATITDRARTLRRLLQAHPNEKLVEPSTPSASWSAQGDLGE